jgi:hypothetical protein
VLHRHPAFFLQQPKSKVFQLLEIDAGLRCSGRAGGFQSHAVALRWTSVDAVMYRRPPVSTLITILLLTAQHPSIPLRHMLHRHLTNLLQHPKIKVVQLLEIDACLAYLELAQFVQKI